MAINIEIPVRPEGTMTSQDFAIMADYMNRQKSDKLYGCRVTMVDNTTLAISDGWCIVRGRIVRINQGTYNFTASQLQAFGNAGESSTWYVLVKVDLTSPIMDNSGIVIQNGRPNDSSDFNFGSTNAAAYLPLAYFNANSTGVISDTLRQYTNIVQSDDHIFIKKLDITTPAAPYAANAWHLISDDAFYLSRSQMPNGVYLFDCYVSVVGSQNDMGFCGCRWGTGKANFAEFSQVGSDVPNGLLTNFTTRASTMLSKTFATGAYDGFASYLKSSFLYLVRDSASLTMRGQVIATQPWTISRAVVSCIRLGDEIFSLNN